MGRRGPRRDPTAIRLLKGVHTNHTRPINEDEPNFEGETVIPNHILKKPEALAEWQRRAPELESLGLLNGQFQGEFADYCMQHAYYLELQKEIEVFGIAQAVKANILKAFESVSINRQRLASRFGFTPADSSSIKVKPSNKPQGVKRFLA